VTELSDRFHRETSDQLRSVSESLLELERRHEPGEPAWGERDRIDGLFRTAHSLKGKFATEGLDGASDLAHALEDLLDAIRAAEVEPSGAVIDDALDALDALTDVVDEAHRRGAVQTDPSPVAERLRGHVDAGTGVTDPPDDAVGDPASTDADEARHGARLSADVQEALDDAAEFDDLERLLSEVDEGSVSTGDDVQGWGVFGDAASDPPAATGGDDATADETDDDEQSDPRELDDMKTFEELQAELDPEEDVNALQSDIDAEEFGEFDDEDTLSIQDLIDAEPASEVAETDADSASAGREAGVREDLETFERLRSDLDPDAEDIDALQSDIDAEEFGEFDDEDDMSIRELLEAEPSDLDPEAALTDQGVDARSPDTEGGDGAASADSDATDGVASADPDATDGVASADSDATADAETGVPEAVDVDESGAESTVETFEFEQVTDGLEGAGGASDDAGGGDAPSRESEDATAGTADRDDSTTPESDDAVTVDTGDPDGEFDLGAEDPFGVESDSQQDAPDLTEIPEEDDELDEALAELGEWSGDDAVEPSPADGIEGAGSGLDEDFAFGFGQESSAFDALEFDSLFTKYFTDEGVLFGEDPTAGTWGARTIEATDVDAARFESLADPEWGAENDVPATEPAQSLTVDVANADRLLRLVEDVGHLQRRLERIATGAAGESVDEILADMRPVTSDLRHTVMNIRLMPLETAVSGLPRVVRTVARDEEKEVELTISGRDVRLDRSIVDRLGDPLVHLVRNAVDHGIEPPAVRAEKGKPPTGQLELRAVRDGDQVVVELEDDGRGIDADAVRQAAIEQGVVDAAEARSLSREAALELLFHPQFSTSEEVTEVSGRGVGLDVVRQTVRDLTGSVEIESAPGEGTTVRLALPVTVAVAQVLFVESGGERFAVPTSVVETTELADGAGDIQELANRYDVSLGDAGGGGVAAAAAADLDLDLDVAATATTGESAPDDASSTATTADDTDEYETVSLAEAFDVDGVAGPERKVVRIQSTVRPLEIRCEDLGDLEEVVVRPFDDVLGGTPGLNGTTTGGDGGVVPVVDVRTL
jgi:two-component system chemotaxis sensor kinase CheA